MNRETTKTALVVPNWLPEGEKQQLITFQESISGCVSRVADIAIPQGTDGNSEANFTHGQMAALQWDAITDLQRAFVKVRSLFEHKANLSGGATTTRK